MERQDIDDELSTTGAQELLASTSAAHLAYIGKDGTPRVIPVGFFWTGDQFVISTATTSPKVTALSARPDVALTIDAGDTPDQARALSIRGRASVEIVDGVVDGVPRRRQENHGRRSGGRVRAAGPRDVRPDGADRDHAALGALLRLRRRPNAAIPAGTGRAGPVLRVGPANLRPVGVGDGGRGFVAIDRVPASWGAVPSPWCHAGNGRFSGNGSDAIWLSHRYWMRFGVRRGFGRMSPRFCTCSPTR